MPSLTPQDINRISDFESLLRFLHDKLDWPVDSSKTIEDVTFDFTADELSVHETAAARLHGGIVRQLRDIRTDQKVGIFFVEFNKEKIYATALRQILRGLVPNRRQSGQRRTWEHDNLLFICATNKYEQFTFAHFSGDKHAMAKLSMFGWQRGDTHVRTLCEFNLRALEWPSDPTNADNWLERWSSAFDVEKVTDRFFESYREVFEAFEREVKKTIKEAETARLYTQRLFNRLMFIYFIQKKGWLSFNGDERYLRALFNTAAENNENFLTDRLYWVFFRGMSIADVDLAKEPEEELRKKRGIVPPLNGGLFEIEDEYDVRGRMSISNGAFGRIFDLFERYNFTVEESTPLDVQVAVDPEMLGKVFEELVTGRHETGSYYTPRPIVSFMCREALKHYLASAQTGKKAVAKFVDEEDASELQNPEAVLEALKRVRICDPACGSGAYLLGMMHELTRLRAALFKSKKIGEAALYDQKRWIIENNLYGVDKDKFAVQIACLRLWLSLAIESETPHPLPNLDFKIECGDSLTGPAPSEAEKQMTFARTALVNDFRQAKGEYMRENDAERKRKLRQKIEDFRAEIALALKHKTPRPAEPQIQRKQQEIALLQTSLDSARNETIKAQIKKQLEKEKRTVAEWQKVTTDDDDAFDWAVEFAEVFMPESAEQWRLDGLHPLLNDFKHQGTLVEEAQPAVESGGFDIVLANPPYIRQELLGRDYKEGKLKPLFPNVYTGTADLYVYFYGRAMQLLATSGVGVFISSNKWLRATYGEKLRQELLDKQKFHLIADFGDLPVFKARAYPCIFIWESEPRSDSPTFWATVESLERCYLDGLREHIQKIAYELPALQFGEGKPRLTTTARADIRAAMQASGPQLTEYVNNTFFRGIVSGLNEAFIINLETKSQLVASDPTSEELIKPLIEGNDVRRYELEYRDKFYIFVPWQCPIKTYPAIFSHLKQFKKKLSARPEVEQGRFPWYAMSRYGSDFWPLFERPKIVYPDISRQPRFSMDLIGYFGTNTTYFIAREDWFLLAILNSATVCKYFQEISSSIRGGYMRFFGAYIEALPIPNAPTDAHGDIAGLSRKTQSLHMKRRKRVEKFLRAIEINPAESSSRNPLEQPWAITADDFTRRARNQPLKKFTAARDETYALTEEITKIEREIDERVAGLYGVPTSVTE